MIEKYTVLLALCLVGYLIGSINGSIIFSKVFGYDDPRSFGSKNPGATNLLRTGNKKLTSFSLLFDMLKGIIVVFFAGFLELSNFEITIICMSCVLGHIFPIFYKFKGGKGVATGLGSLLAFDIVLGSICIITWLTMLKIYGFSSLAAIVTFFLLPLHAFFTYNSFKVTVIIVMMSAIIIWRHKDNIQNLVNKTESKIGKK